MPRGWQRDGRFAVEVVAHVQPRQRCDLDNVAKQVGDALNRLVWIDDRRIDAWALVRRVDRDQPRVEVHVVALDPEREQADVEITIASKTKPRGAVTPGAMTDKEDSWREP